MGEERLFPRGAEPEKGALLHRDPAAEHHGPAPHGARHRRNAAGRADPLQAHGGLRDALAPRHRPRVHRHGGQNRRADAQGGPRQARPRPRGLPRARVGVEARIRRKDRRAAQEARLLLRLGARALHHGRGLQPRRDEGVRRALQHGFDLPRGPHHQLVPRVQDRALRRGGRIRGAVEPSLARALRRAGSVLLHHLRHDPPGNDSRRHGRGRQSRGPAL